MQKISVLLNGFLKSEWFQGWLPMIQWLYNYQLKYSSLTMYVLNINQYQVTLGPVEVVFSLAPLWTKVFVSTAKASLLLTI